MKNYEAKRMLGEHDAEDMYDSKSCVEKNEEVDLIEKKKFAFWEFISKKLMLKEEEWKFTRHAPVEYLF